MDFSFNALSNAEGVDVEVIRYIICRYFNISDVSELTKYKKPRVSQSFSSDNRNYHFDDHWFPDLDNDMQMPLVDSFDSTIAKIESELFPAIIQNQEEAIDDVLGMYFPMRSPAKIYLCKDNLYKYFIMVIMKLDHYNLKISEITALAVVCVELTFFHEHFHFHTDIVSRIYGLNKFSREKEESLACAYSYLMVLDVVRPFFRDRIRVKDKTIGYFILREAVAHLSRFFAEKAYKGPCENDINHKPYNESYNMRLKEDSFIRQVIGDHMMNNISPGYKDWVEHCKVFNFVKAFDNKNVIYSNPVIIDMIDSKINISNLIMNNLEEIYNHEAVYCVK